MRLTKLTLTTFRNHSMFTAEIPVKEDGQIIAILGPNGSGKTSILEALSLLSPGRGLHKAKPEEMVQHNAKQWGIYAELTDETSIGQAFQNKKRLLKINNTEAPKLSDLATLGSVIWLTPAQDRLFLDGAAARRDVLDRFTYGLNPAHAETVARYKHHAGARLKLLKQHADPDWIDLEEQQAADWGIQVLQNRLNYLEALKPHLQEITLNLTGATLQVLEEEDPVTALKGKFERSRERDADVGATHTGPQKIDLTATLHLDHESHLTPRTSHLIPAHSASSGQHKRILMQLILAHVRLVTEQKGQPPLILMDEIAAHLDAEKREHLLKTLTNLNAQLWLTETEQDRLGDIKPDLIINLPQ